MTKSTPPLRAWRTVLCACCVALAALLAHSPAFATTENFDTDPGSPLNTYPASSTATYGGFLYSYRTGARALTSDIIWQNGYGVGDSGVMMTDSASTYTGRELDIQRSNLAKFNFTGLSHKTYSPNSGSCETVNVTFQGYSGVYPTRPD